MFYVTMSIAFFMWFHGNQFDGGSNRHPKEAKENAYEPLELCERHGVSKISQELDNDELEDGGASKDAHENGVVQKALENIDLVHVPRAYLIEHLDVIHRFSNETYVKELAVTTIGSTIECRTKCEDFVMADLPGRRQKC